MDINRLPEHVFTESLHERGEEVLLHRRDRGIVVTALAEERVGACLHGVGFEHPVHAQALAGCIDHGEQGHRHRAEQDAVAQALELAVDRALSQHRIECPGIEEDVNVFREPLNQVPAFRKARAALENDLVPDGIRDEAERLGDVVVLFDERRPETAGSEVFRRLEDRLLEVRMIKTASS